MGKSRKMISILTALVMVVCSLTGVITGADEMESLDIVEYADDAYVEDIEAVDEVEAVDETVESIEETEEVVGSEFIEVEEDLESGDASWNTMGAEESFETTQDTDHESSIEITEDFTEITEDDTAAAEELAGEAEGISYVVRSWNAETKQVESRMEVCTDYAVITGDTRELSGWYISNSHLELSDRLVVKGTAHIILCDSSTLHCEDGINVSGGSTLNIYCQENESGILYCDADTNDNAAIGADDEDGDCGTINIYGGDITADTDTDGTDGAGIGGGDEGNGGTVTIYGGTVRAKGGSYGAGIGGGDADGNGGNGGTTIIYGGTVTATGGTDAAGIGGGEEGNGGTVEIWGGTVTATGGSNSAGIGGGENGNGGTITINGGAVNVYAGNNGAGLGGGDRGEGGTITINNGTVNARGGDDGAAIGGGDTKSAGIITINGGHVTALSTGWAAAIGGGDWGDCGTITITGGEVEAIGNRMGAAIGSGNAYTISGDHMAFTHKGTIRIEGGEVAARFSEEDPAGAGIGSGRCADMAGSIIISGGLVSAVSIQGAAIGSGCDSDMTGDITITGGEVRATCGNADRPAYGAAIGAGEKDTDSGKGGNCTGKITIEGGTVEALILREYTFDRPSAIGHGAGSERYESALSLAEGLRVTSGESKDNAALQVFEDREKGCHMMYARVEPCTDHTFSEMPVSDGSDTPRYRCTACNFGGEPKDIGVPYLVRSWNAETKQVETSTDVCTNYSVIDSHTKLLSGWYVSNNHLELTQRLVVRDTANIILCDSSSLGCIEGINVSEGCTLNIYCQEGGGGILYCDANTKDNAAIGADNEAGDCGTINIYGGNITADTNTKGTDGAGIGGGDEGNGGTVTIYGGTVTAKGGKYGAGIGGGDADGKGGSGGTTIIYGGTVNATGGTDAAGIGGGEEGNGGTVEIWGGTVNAKGGGDGAGIGGGDTKAGGTITINGGNVTATATGPAAAIGGGDWGDCGRITIKGGKIEAVGNHDGAAIGSGSGKGVGHSNGKYTGEILITGGDITARFSDGSATGAAIGSGDDVWMNGSIVISGGQIDAEAGSGSGAAIGAGFEGKVEGSITITGGDIKAKSTGGAGIGSGANNTADQSCTGMISITGGTVEAMTVKRDDFAAPSAIGRGESTVLEDENGDAIKVNPDSSPITISDGLRVTSGESKDIAAAQAYEDRVKGCHMLYTRIEPCTNHTFSEMHEAGADASRSLHCTFCNEKGERQFHPFAGHDLSLAGDIGMVYYLDLTDEEASGKSMEFNWGVYGENMTVVEKHESCPLEKDEASGLYVAICPVSVAEMIYSIDASLTLDGNTYTDRYAAIEFADVILSDQGFAESYVGSENAAGRDGEQRLSQVRDLMKAMLSYGSAAQVQFDRAPEILANRLFVTDNPGDPYYYVPEAVDAAMINTGAGSMSEGLDAYGLEYVSSTLVYLSKTSLRHYYRITDQEKFNAVKDSITFNGEACSAIAKDNMIYFELPDIGAPDLDTLFTLKIGETEYRYSALDYAKMCLETAETSESLKELAKATYRYNKAANLFFGE